MEQYRCNDRLFINFMKSARFKVNIMQYKVKSKICSQLISDARSYRIIVHNTSGNIMDIINCRFSVNSDF